MTKLPLNNDDREKQATDEAWARLQATLAGEPMNPRWSEWELTQAIDEGAAAISVFPGVTTEETLQDGISADSDVSIENKVPAPRRTMTRRSKWVTVAAGVVALAVILATPIGNTAMAAILNQFRMETVTTVNENELRDMFYKLSDTDNFHEAVNSFGTFTSTPGTFYGEMSPEQVQDNLGYSPLSAALQNNIQKTLFVSPSQDLLLDLNIDKVNEVMKRLGAVKLLPESVNGKPITLHIPESVNYQLGEKKTDWASLQQMKTPILTVDPSIEVEEALEAVINFPLLPDNLKRSLEQTGVLSGEIPMPVVVGNNNEQIEVAGVKVMLEKYIMGKDTNYYNAIWVKDGQLFNFNGGNMFSSKETMIAKLQELIQS
ncbi:hypothetical protein [Paenibacillus sp. GCM10012306]|uniref:hypothetical protein n=1 Tax=Paenibacillus sp. GCM10012306 TaxID=3317342 RepID=UPI00360851B0